MTSPINATSSSSPTGTTDSVSPSQREQAGPLCIPTEILLAITHNLHNDIPTLGRLMLTSHTFYHLAAPHLYRHVTWNPQSTTSSLANAGNKWSLLNYTCSLQVSEHSLPECPAPRSFLESPKSACPSLGRLETLVYKLRQSSRCRCKCPLLSQARPSTLICIEDGAPLRDLGASTLLESGFASKATHVHFKLESPESLCSFIFDRHSALHTLLPKYATVTIDVNFTSLFLPLQFTNASDHTYIGDLGKVMTSLVNHVRRRPSPKTLFHIRLYRLFTRCCLPHEDDEAARAAQEGWEAGMYKVRRRLAAREVNFELPEYLRDRIIVVDKGMPLQHAMCTGHPRTFPSGWAADLGSDGDRE